MTEMMRMVERRDPSSRGNPHFDETLSANMTETPGAFGITVGRWR